MLELYPAYPLCLRHGVTFFLIEPYMLYRPVSVLLNFSPPLVATRPLFSLYRFSFPGVKRPRREVDTLPPSGTVVKN